MGKISNTWSMMSESWQILKQDKELLVLPLISGICCLLVMASFAIPAFSTDSWQPPAEDATTGQQVGYYAMLFAFYFCNYFVIIFFNTALIACVAIRLQGGDPALKDGFRLAFRRIHEIFGWTLVMATVGLLLRVIEDRFERVGRFITALLGMVWTAVSFLVIPVLIIEGKKPLASLKESTRLLKKTWGEQLISNFSFGLIWFLLGIPAYLVVAVGVFLVMQGSVVLGGVCLAAAVVYLVVLALINTALQGVFQAVLFFYARDGHIPESARFAFQGEELAGAYRMR